MRLFAVLLAALALLPHGDAIAIKDVTIVASPEKTIAKGTIVIRDGLIVSVGEDVAPPAGAEIIDGKGLFAYAGFIDAHASAGLPDTKRTPEQQKTAEGTPHEFTKEAPPRMAEANRKGLRPELNVSDIINLTEADAKSWTGQGFTAANVAVREEFISGRGALVALSGSPRRQALMVSELFMHFGWKNYGDGYPGTVMGILSHLRQILMDARFSREQLDAYAANPTGRKRPPADPALEALLPVLDGKVAVCFEANSDTEILRAIALAKEFNLKLVISGGQEAFKVADQLKDIPVLLSLNIPKEPKVLHKEQAKEYVEKPAKLIAEEKRLWEEKLQCAVKLNEAGVRFAFSTWGTTASEAMANLPKVKLPKPALIRALTQAPAQIFGVEKQLGTIEAGKIANLTVLSKAVGERGARMRFVFIDGKKFETEAAKKPEMDLTGAWKGSAQLPEGAFEFTLDLKQEGNELNGTTKSKFGELTLAGGQVSGNQVEFTLTVEGIGELIFKGEFKESKLSGKVAGAGRDAEWSASKPK